MIYLQVFHIDAVRFTGKGTFATPGTGCCIHVDPEKGYSRQQAEHGTHRTNRIAVKPSVEQRKPYHHHQCNKRYQHGMPGDQLKVEPVKKVNVKPLQQAGQTIVGHNYPRPDDIGEDPSETAVGIEQVQQEETAENQEPNGEDQKRITDVIQGLFELIPLNYAQVFGNPGEDILKNAQGTNGRTIYPAKESGKDQYDDKTDSCKHRYRDESYQGGHELEK